MSTFINIDRKIINTDNIGWIGEIVHLPERSGEEESYHFTIYMKYTPNLVISNKYFELVQKAYNELSNKLNIGD